MKQSAGVIFLFFTADSLFQQNYSNNQIHKLSQLFNRCQRTSATAQAVGYFSSFSKRQQPFLRQSQYFTFLCPKKSTMTVILLLKQVKNNLKYKCHLLLMFSKAWFQAPNTAALLIQLSRTNFKIYRSALLPFYTFSKPLLIATFRNKLYFLQKQKTLQILIFKIIIAVIQVCITLISIFFSTFSRKMAFQRGNNFGGCSTILF